ncbi:MAG TPA: hypothetical protein VGK67_19760 [Myxococcales bacterium]|jgi:hypothetical protein
MRLRPWLLAAFLLGACGDTLVDRAGVPLEGADADVVFPGSDAGAPAPFDGGVAGSDAGSGLACAADDPCTCTPCTATAQCAAGLQCVEGKRKGVSCGFSVCISGGH